MLLVDCPHCSRRMQVEDNAVGTVVPCAFCTQALQIEPVLQEIAKSPAAHQPVINIHLPPAPPAVRERTGDIHKRAFAQSSGSALGIMYVLGGVALLFVALCVGINFLAFIQEDRQIQSAIADETTIIAKAKTILARHDVKGEFSSDTRVDLTETRWGTSHIVSGSVFQHDTAIHFIVGFEITDFQGKRLYQTTFVEIDGERVFSE